MGMTRLGRKETRETLHTQGTAAKGPRTLSPLRCLSAACSPSFQKQASPLTMPPPAGGRALAHQAAIFPTSELEMCVCV